MKRALIFGAAGGLATHITQDFVSRGWAVDAVTRPGGAVESRPGVTVHQAPGGYAAYRPATSHDAYVFPQALFSTQPLEAMSDNAIEEMAAVGFTDLIKTVRNTLRVPAPSADARQDYAIVGSTSSYAGFRNTAVYCAVKHGVLGLVRALNDEYAGTGRRFWLFSMGTMDTAMGRQVQGQDPTTFLPPADVAERIVETLASPSNLFEPEVIIRRRIIRMAGR